MGLLGFVSHYSKSTSVIVATAAPFSLEKMPLDRGRSRQRETFGVAVCLELKCSTVHSSVLHRCYPAGQLAKRFLVRGSQDAGLCF
jgi:hypothetical protein